MIFITIIRQLISSLTSQDGVSGTNLSVQQERQNQRQNQLQQQLSQQQERTNFPDYSSALSKSEFVDFLRGQWSRTYKEKIPLELSKVLNNITSKIKACSNYDDFTDSSRGGSVRDECLLILHKELGILVDANKSDIDYVAAIRVIKTVMSLAMLRAGNSGANVVDICKKDDACVVDKLISNYHILGSIFDLLAGNIVQNDYINNIEDFYEEGKNTSIPCADEYGDVDNCIISSSHVKISMDAVSHFLQQGFEGALGSRLYAGLDFIPGISPGLEIFVSSSWSYDGVMRDHSSSLFSVRLKSYSGDNLPEWLYLHNGTLRFDRGAYENHRNDITASHSELFDAEKRKINACRAAGIFSRESNSAAWTLLAMVKNDHNLRPCLGFDELMSSFGDDDSQEYKHSYNTFAERYNSFIKNMPEFWGRNFFDELNDVIAIGESFTFKDEKFNREVKLQLAALKSFNEKVDELVSFFLSVVDSDQQKAEGEFDMLLPLDLEKMLPNRCRGENAPASLKRVESAVISDLTGFYDLVLAFNKKRCKKSKESSSASKALVLQECLQERIEHLFPVAVIFSRESGAFSSEKFFKVLGFNIFHKASGGECSLAEFNDFYEALEAETSSPFSAILGQKESIEESAAIKLETQGLEKALRQDKMLSPGAHKLFRSLLIGDFRIIQQKMLKLLAAASKRDKKAQAQELAGLNYLAMNFPRKLIADKQGYLGFDGVVSEYSFPPEVIRYCLKSGISDEKILKRFISDVRIFRDKEMYCIGDAIGYVDTERRLQASILARTYIKIVCSKDLGYDISSQVDKVFWNLAASTPGYDETKFREIEQKLLENIEAIAVTPLAQKALRHFILESALIDQDPKKTAENWEHIGAAIAGIFSKDGAFAAVALNGAAQAGNAVISLCSPIFLKNYAGDEVRDFNFDSWLYDFLDNARFCSSYAMKVYFQAVQESYNNWQMTEVITNTVKNVVDESKGYESTQLAIIIKVLHKEKLGNSFLNGITELNLEPFLKDKSGRSRGDEGFNEDEAGRKAFFRRLAFFAEVYGIEKRKSENLLSWGSDDKSKIKGLPLNLQKALLRGTCISDKEDFNKLVDSMLESKIDKKVITYCINTAIKMNVAVDKDLLAEFINLADDKDAHLSQSMSNTSVSVISNDCVLSDSGSNDDMGGEAQDISADNYAKIDAYLELLPAFQAKGGVVAKDFADVIDDINKDYAEPLQKNISEIVNSIKVAGSSMQMAGELKQAFAELHKLDSHMKSLAIESVAALVKGGITEPNLVHLLKMLEDNKSVGYLANFIEAVTVLRAKKVDLPANLTGICIKFLASCNQNISSPEARASLAASFLLGYNKDFVLTEADIAPLHQLPRELFTALEDSEVDAFVKLDVASAKHDTANDAYARNRDDLLHIKAKIESTCEKLSAVFFDVDAASKALSENKCKLEKLETQYSVLAQKESAFKAALEETEQEVKTRVAELQKEVAKLEEASRPQANTGLSLNEMAASGNRTSQIEAKKAEIAVMIADKQSKTENLRIDLTSATEAKGETDTAVKEQKELVAKLQAKVKGLEVSKDQYIKDSNDEVPVMQKRFAELYPVCERARDALIDAKSNLEDLKENMTLIIKGDGVESKDSKLKKTFLDAKMSKINENNSDTELQGIQEEFEERIETLKCIALSLEGLNIGGVDTSSCSSHSLSALSSLSDTTLSAVLPMSTIEFHASIAKILDKRAEAAKPLWQMISSALVGRQELRSLHRSISHANHILEIHLNGEADIIFTAVINHYKSDHAGFIALMKGMEGLEDEQQAHLLKLVYLYIENGESLEGVAGLAGHLAGSQNKADLLATRLIHPPFWSIHAIMEKDSSELETTENYDRVLREYSKFNDIKAKFHTLAGDNLFDGSFTEGDFCAALQKLDDDNRCLILEDLQARLVTARAKFSSDNTVPSDQEILETACNVAEVLARVSFDINSDKRQAKELRLEQIMSVFAWLKLGFSEKGNVWNQVETGEGKSRINAVVAGAAAVLSGGKTVQMEFNSRYLALRGLEEFSFLFKQLFGDAVAVDLGVVVDAKSSPAAYKKSQIGVQAVNFVSTAEYLLSSKGSDIAFIKYFNGENLTKVKEQADQGAIFLIDESVKDAVGDLIDVKESRIRVTADIEKEVIASKALSHDAKIVVISDKVMDVKDVEFIKVSQQLVAQEDFTDSKGIIKVRDEADFKSNIDEPCNISSPKMGNGYWDDSPSGSDDGIYYYVVRWVFAKLQDNSALLSSSLTHEDLADFKAFVEKGEEENYNSDSNRVIKETLAQVDLQKLQVWFESTLDAKSMQEGVDFKIIDGYRGKYGERRAEIVPLNEGGSAMLGAFFSRGVHQILRYLINSGELNQVPYKKSVKDHFLSLLGWRIRANAVDLRDTVLLQPPEAPIVASKRNLIVVPKDLKDTRDRNTQIDFKTTGTVPFEVIEAAGDKALITPRATDLRRKYLPTVHAASHLQQVLEIVREVEQCKLDRRPICISCKDEAESELIFGMLSNPEVLSGMKLQLYSSTLEQYEKERIISEAGKIGVVTVGTVIDLGRGVDIKPSEEAKHNGGLYFALTYLPKDMATYLQAIARSGRNGADGTVRVIRRGPVTSEAAIANKRKAYNDRANVSYIKAVYEAPYKAYEAKVFAAFEQRKLDISHREKLYDLNANIIAYQEAKRNKVNEKVQNAIMKSWFRWIGVRKAKQILRSYNEGVVEHYNNALEKKFSGSQEVIDALRLKADENLFESSIADSVEFLKSLKSAKTYAQAIPVASEYHPSHAGQAVMYSNPLWFIDATLKGYNVLGDHIVSFFRGGDMLPNLTAFLTLRAWPPVIAEIIEYFRLESDSNDRKIVNKSLLKITAYMMFLGMLVASLFLASDLMLLAAVTLPLLTIGSLLYYQSELIKVKEQAKYADAHIMQRLLASSKKVGAEIKVTYEAPYYLRKLSQIMVYVMFFAMAIGVYMAFAHYFYSVYSAAVLINPGLANINFAWLHSSILSMMLAVNMHSFYKKHKGVFALPRGLIQDARGKWRELIFKFGGEITVQAVMLSAVYFILSWLHFFLYIELCAIIMSCYFWLVVFFLAKPVFFIIVSAALSFLVSAFDFIYRLLKMEIKLSQLKRQIVSVFRLCLEKIALIMSVAQIAFICCIGFFILTLPFPSLVILGANFIPLINVSLLSVYVMCARDQIKFLTAQMFHFTSMYIKGEIINSDGNNAEKYSAANKETSIGRALRAVKIGVGKIDIIGGLKKAKDFVWSVFTRSGSNAQSSSNGDNSTRDESQGMYNILVGKDAVNEYFDPAKEEAEWRENNAEAIRKYNFKLYLQPVRALCAVAAGFASYSLIIGVSSSPLFMVLAAAAAIYSGVFADSFVEDMFHNLVFDKESDFALFAIPKIKRIYQDKNPLSAEESKLTRVCWWKIFGQKLFNAVTMLFFAPLSFVRATLMLPVRFISNLDISRGDKISKMQLASLVSFGFAVLFLFMAINSAPLLAICMALYLNNVLSYGLMVTMNLYSIDTSKKTPGYYSEFLGYMGELIFGCDIKEILSGGEPNSTRFNSWVKEYADPKYIKEPQDEVSTSAPLGRIINPWRY